MKLYSLYRRDFRLLIADPDNPSKPIANPVLWLPISLATEVIYIFNVFYKIRDFTLDTYEKGKKRRDSSS